MSSFLDILQKITGRNNTGVFKDEIIDYKSPTGKKDISYETTAKLIDSFRYPSKNELETRAREYMEGQPWYNQSYYNGWGSNTASKALGFYDGSYDDTDDSAGIVGTNQPEYVPFVYTKTDDPNEPIKYGYIIRYAAGGDRRTVDGLTLENKDYTSEGAKKFFDDIKKNRGRIKLYYERPKSEYREDVRLQDVEHSTKDGQRSTYAKTPDRDTAFIGSYDIINALREANAQNRKNFGK